MTTPYRVRAVYLLPKDEEASDPQVREKIDVALKMMQSVAAESMRVTRDFLNAPERYLRHLDDDR